MTYWNRKMVRWETYLCKDCGQNHETVKEAWDCDNSRGLR